VPITLPPPPHPLNPNPTCLSRQVQMCEFNKFKKEQAKCHKRHQLTSPLDRYATAHGDKKASTAAANNTQSVPAAAVHAAEKCATLDVKNLDECRKAHFEKQAEKALGRYDTLIKQFVNQHGRMKVAALNVAADTVALADKELKSISPESVSFVCFSLCFTNALLMHWHCQCNVHFCCCLLGRCNWATPGHTSCANLVFCRSPGREYRLIRGEPHRAMRPLGECKDGPGTEESPGTTAMAAAALETFSSWMCGEFEELKGLGWVWVRLVGIRTDPSRLGRKGHKGAFGSKPQVMHADGSFPFENVPAHWQACESINSFVCSGPSGHSIALADDYSAAALSLSM
jgi:hypothetical protein